MGAAVGAAAVRVDVSTEPSGVGRFPAAVRAPPPSKIAVWHPQGLREIANEQIGWRWR